MIQQYQSPLAVGDTVRITAAVCKGLVGELKTIDFEEPDENFFGVRIDEIEGWIFFRADELEKVEPEEDKPHPDECLCDECAAFRFAVCGYDD